MHWMHVQVDHLNPRGLTGSCCRHRRLSVIVRLLRNHRTVHFHSAHPLPSRSAGGSLTKSSKSTSNHANQTDSAWPPSYQKQWNDTEINLNLNIIKNHSDSKLIQVQAVPNENTCPTYSKTALSNRACCNGPTSDCSSTFKVCMEIGQTYLTCVLTPKHECQNGLKHWKVKQKITWDANHVFSVSHSLFNVPFVPVLNVFLYDLAECVLQCLFHKFSSRPWSSTDSIYLQVGLVQVL